MPAQPFWQRKTLAEVDQQEWESLCDGCGKCCLHKLEDEDTDEVFYTRIACVLLDVPSCRCRDYSNRLLRVPECLALKPEDVSSFHWLPKTCSYRLISEGQPLPSWHPLVSGDPQQVHQAGVSIRKWAISESEVDEDDWFDHLLVDADL
ncbi:MAG: YcgN family cysteine cluster protein [Motiliproteus sp.]|nr:YcgN family cysteine cluster protein [Motiliproteus sp.]MCW9053341.1 YcgN family cysteine cluster protein [Motiliproteus sp.]